MTDKSDPNKTQQELFDAMRRMMQQSAPVRSPEPAKVDEEKEDTKRKKREAILNFGLRPKEVKKHLDRFVIKQDTAKRVLATAVCDHYNHVRACETGKLFVNYSKQNVLMLGPTGVGKTYLIKCLAELIGVPFVKGDATKFSETGYVGGDVEDLIRDLVHKADGDVELAKYGIIYIDEIDKISTPSELMGRDVSGSGVQRGLLKIMEETEVPLRAAHDMQAQIQSMLEYQQKGKITKPVINTRYILFIVSGVFDGMRKIVEERQKADVIGFRAAEKSLRTSSEIFHESRTEDFIRFGFEPEFIGRLPVRVVCDPLSEEDLYQILTTSEGSVLRQYRDSFEAYGIEMRLEEQALWEIAKLAHAEGTGARGLLTVCERVLRDVKYELPSTRLKVFDLTREMVGDPQRALAALLSEEQKEQRAAILAGIREYEKGFLQRHGIRIELDDSACRAVAARLLENSQPVGEFLDRILANYGYGLGLIRQKNDTGMFLLTEEVISQPNVVLDRWVKESYESKGGSGGNAS